LAVEASSNWLSERDISNGVRTASGHRKEKMMIADSIPANEDQQILGASEKITLSAKDWDVFYRALIDPPEPNEKLKEEARRYRERFGGCPGGRA
jgi:hypothetical protein